MLSGVATALVLVGVSWGVLRNRVANVVARLDEGDARMDRMEEAIRSALDVGHKVDLLSQRTDASHELLRMQQKSQETLLGEKMDGVRGEVRSFMQGQASMVGAKSA